MIIVIRKLFRWDDISMLTEPKILNIIRNYRLMGCCPVANENELFLHLNKSVLLKAVIIYFLLFTTKLHVLHRNLFIVCSVYIRYL